MICQDAGVRPFSLFAIPGAGYSPVFKKRFSGPLLPVPRSLRADRDVQARDEECEREARAEEHDG